ncbi:MAG TPA: hypothetical protein VKV02_04125 [Acidobacteriaceae bacterium]|nr:hypothetical protein [Acidobacteriaceae bacterium]
MVGPEQSGHKVEDQVEELMERMNAAIASLELAAERLSEREVALSAEAEERVERIVATVEGQREAELAERLHAAEAKLAEAEARIAELSAAASVSASATASGVSGRKTLSAGMVSTLAKQGIAAGALEGLEAGRFEAGALDAALTSLSIEQRFAVKAEMFRAGLLG